MVKLGSKEGVALIALNVGLFATFIGIFFFTFGAYIEKLVLRRQIKYILDGFIGDIKSFATPDQLQTISRSVENLPPVSTSADKKVLDNNKALTKETFKVFGVLLGVVLLLVGGLWISSGRAFSLSRMFVESLSLLVVVGLVELTFYSLIPAFYRSVDANFVKEIIIDNASKFADK